MEDPNYQEYVAKVKEWWNEGNPKDDWGPSTGWNNGFVGWSLQASVNRIDGNIVSYGFSVHGDVPNPFYNLRGKRKVKI